MIGYRSFLNVESDSDTIDAIDRLAIEWMRGKDWTEETLEIGRTSKIQVGVTGRRIRADVSSGEAIAFEFVEDQATGRWTTRFTAFVPFVGDDGWVLTEIDAPEIRRPDGTTEDAWVEAPKLTRSFIEELSISDHGLPIASDVQIINKAQVGELVDGILNPKRRSPVVVAVVDSTAGDALEATQKNIEFALRKTAGLSAQFILDSDASEEFNLRMGESHGQGPGTLRFFDRKVDLRNPWDARRHRNYEFSRLMHQGRVPRSLLDEFGSVARRISNRFPIDIEVRNIEQALMREGAKQRHKVVNSHDASGDLWVAPESVQERVVTDPTKYATTTFIATPEFVEQGKSQAVPAAAPPLKEKQKEGPGEKDSDPAGQGIDRALETFLKNLVGIPQSHSLAPEHFETLSAHLTEAESKESEQSIVVSNLRNTIVRLQDELQRKTTATVQSMDSEIEELFDSLDEKNTEIERIGGQLRDLTTSFDDLQLENAEFLERISEEQEQTRFLYKQLALSPETNYLEERELDSKDTPPKSFGELVERVSDLVNVECTWDRAQVTELDGHDAVGTWVTKSWLALCALDDYVRAKSNEDWSGNFHSYLGKTPRGYRSYQATRHAAQESEDVQRNPKYKEPRRFPVPTEVDPSGSNYMWAHFKIGQSGKISPRLHYVDSSHNYGKVIVGYLGRHLPTGMGDA